MVAESVHRARGGAGRCLLVVTVNCWAYCALSLRVAPRVSRQKMCLLLDKGAGNRLERKRPALKASGTGERVAESVPRAGGESGTGWRLGAGRGQGGRAEGRVSEVSRASAAPTARSPKPPARPRPERWRLDGRRDARARARAAGDERQRPKNEIQPPRAPPKAERQGEATGEMRAPHQTKSEPFGGSLTIFLCTEHQVFFSFHLDSNWMGVPSYHFGLKFVI